MMKAASSAKEIKRHSVISQSSEVSRWRSCELMQFLFEGLLFGVGVKG